MPIKRRPLQMETISRQPAVQPVQNVTPAAGTRTLTLRDYMTTRGNGRVPRSNAIQGFKCGGLNKK
jgi:hypothetical protein